jgi:hypothetical protein
VTTEERRVVTAEPELWLSFEALPNVATRFVGSADADERRDTQLELRRVDTQARSRVSRHSRVHLGSAP